MENDQPPHLPDKSKRKFLVGTAAITGAALGTKLGLPELQIAEKGYFTHNGVQFQPLYERHDIGPHVEISKYAKYLFKESNIYDATDPRITLTHTLDMPSLLANSRNIDPSGVLDDAINQQTLLAFGDISTSETREWLDKYDNNDAIVTSLEFTRWVGGMSAMLYAILEDQKSQLNNEPIKRRNFLKVALRSGIGLAGLWASQTSFSQTLLLTNQELPHIRIFNKIQGFMSNFDPNDTIIFYRNLVMARKIQLLADKTTHDYPNPSERLIAYQLGSAHKGVDDLIQMPEEFLRYAIVTFQPQHTKELYQTFGDYLGSVRVGSVDSQTGAVTELPPLVDTQLLDTIKHEL